MTNSLLRAFSVFLLKADYEIILAEDEPVNPENEIINLNKETKFALRNPIIINQAQ